MNTLNLRGEPHVSGRRSFYTPGDKPIIKIPLSQEEKWDLFPKIVFLGICVTGGVYMVVSALVLLFRCYLETGFCP